MIMNNLRIRYLIPPISKNKSLICLNNLRALSYQFNFKIT